MNDRKTYLSRFWARFWGRVLGSVVIALIIVACVEFLGYQFLQLQLRNHHYLFEFPIEQHLANLSDRKIHAWMEGRRAYVADPETGWTRTPSRQSSTHASWTLTSDDTGARVIPGQRGSIWLSTYGDSFTECVDVNDDQTWQAYLVQELGGQIRNYGVAGFGPDQALLYLEHNLERGLGTPIVVLAMIEENLDRILNSFRPFYTWPDVDFALGFKPRFVRDPGGSFVLKNPYPGNWDRPTIKNAITDAAGFDHFYPRRVERIAFPFSLAAARLIRRQGLILKEWLPRESGLAAETLFFLLKHFAELSRRYDFTPVLVLLPSSGDQIKHAQVGYEDFVSKINAAGAPEGLVYVNVVEALAGPGGLDYLQGLTLDHYTQINHASPEANAAVARVLSGQLGPMATAARGGAEPRQRP